jgi:hypothetical protein
MVVHQHDDPAYLTIAALRPTGQGNVKVGKGKADFQMTMTAVRLRLEAG